MVAAYGNKVRLVCQENAGASAARNTGLALVSAPYVFFLDGDDYVEGDFVGGALRALDEFSADVVFAPFDYERIGGQRSSVFHYATVPSPRNIFSGWLDHFSQPPCSIVWRTSFARAVGGWDERVSLNDDGEFAMRAMLSNPIISSFDEGRGIYNVQDTYSLSKTRTPQALHAEFEAMQRLIVRARCTEGFGDLTGFVGDIELGREALAQARNVGLAGHPGTFGHRLVASLIGLQRKTRLAALLRAVA